MEWVSGKVFDFHKDQKQALVFAGKRTYNYQLSHG